MVIDGKKIAEDVYAHTRASAVRLGRSAKLTVITCAPNFETRKYLALKEKKAMEVGIEATVVEFPETATTEAFVARIQEEITNADGIIVQLPLPVHIDRDVVINAVPTSHDVDALNPHTVKPLSPVVGAIREILERHKVMVAGMHVAVIGNGKLVGIPAYQWFVSQGAHVSVVTKDVPDIENYTKPADIVVCGAGVPGLIKPDMIKEGVIIFDAGTSEDGGELRGDASPLCAEKASLFTPVPGGIGPITIAMLLKNVVDCAHENQGVL
jgi:methylenetetrahydrofolate dehydrogenase (NADP+)/methenyltetrahydrofolate cyclohydrolase